MDEKQFFLKVGECHWVNPFPGNITHARLTDNFDGEPVLDVHMVGDQRLRWRTNTVEAKVFIQWLDDQSIDLVKKYPGKAEKEVAT